MAMSIKFIDTKIKYIDTIRVVYTRAIALLHFDK